MNDTSSSARLTPDQSDLVASYMPLAMKMVERWSARCPWRREEFRDAAIDGLIAAARFYNPTVYPVFYPLARKSVSLYLLRRARDCYSRPRLLSIHVHEDDQVGRFDPPTFDPPIDETPDVHHLVNGLPEPQQELIRLRYLNGLTLKQVAARMRIGHPNVGRIERIALESLRAAVPAGLLAEGGAL